jgi:hypothetical protein
VDALTRLRRAASAVVALGLGLSSLGPATAPVAPQHAAGFTVLAGDFHVHSYPDGLPAWEAAREARRRRLDVIALTSHNSMIGWWLWTHRPLPVDAGGLLVLPGEELTSVGYHAALVSISRTVGWHHTIAEAAAAVHAQGGAAILAHPSGRNLSRVVTDAALRAVDGVEVAHPGMETSPRVQREFRDTYSRARALDASTAAIGSSDFHYFAPVGASRTYLFAREFTADAVVEAIRAGRTVACDGHGRVYGTAELARLVADRCRVEQAASPEGETRLTRLASALVWAGVLGLVVAGARRS